MSVDCYATVWNCVELTRHRVRLRRHNNLTIVFLALAPLEFIDPDILGKLVSTPQKVQYLLGISDCSFKISQTVLLWAILARTVAKAFFTYWDMSRELQRRLLSDNGKHLTSKVSQQVYKILKIENVSRDAPTTDQ